jgi:predicted porin
MKKTLIVAAALSAIAGTAAAQSSVTLFGIVDVSARYVKNNTGLASGNAHTKQLASGGLNTSRLGFRGTEDLGGGYKAHFWLEAALGVDNGTAGGTGNAAGKFFSRRSTVAIELPIGEVRLGRDYTPQYNATLIFDPFGNTGLGQYQKLLDMKLGGSTVNTDTRADNQISYFLPKNIGGMYGQLSIAPVEGTLGNKYIGGHLGYSAFGLNVAGSFSQTYAGRSTAVLVPPAVTEFKEKHKQSSIGVSYDFKVLKIMGVLSQYKYVNYKENLFTLGAHVPVSSVGLFRFSWNRADLKASAQTTATPAAPVLTAAGAATYSKNDANMFAFGYEHMLSKRTSLYSTVSYIKNKETQRFGVGETVPGLGLVGAKSGGVDLGVKHSF